jgi:hypothetical protein
MSDEGKKKVRENLVKAQLTKKVKDLESSLINGGKSNTEKRKDQKRATSDKKIKAEYRQSMPKRKRKRNK